MTRIQKRSQLLLLLAKSVPYSQPLSHTPGIQLPHITTYNTVPHSQPLSYTPAAYLPIITTTHPTITHYSQQLDYTPTTHCLPPVSSNYYPLGYSQPPLPLTSPSYDDTTMAHDRDPCIVHELTLLKQRMARLEAKLASTNNSEMISNDTGIPELN